MIVVVLFTLLAAGIFYVFRAVLLSWSSAEERSGIDITLDRGIEEMVRELREASGIGSVQNDEIRYTLDGATYSIYYLYNAADSYPPSFSESAYDIRQETLTGGIGGTFSYGSGKIVMTDVVPPATSDLSISGNMITLDVSITRNDETVRSRTEVRPRNL